MSSNIDKIPEVTPPLPRKINWSRDVGMDAPMRWLKAGWSDLKIKPMKSLAYGFLVFFISVILFGSMFAFGFDYIIFPATAGFMVVGPALAVGLYNKSRDIAMKNESGMAPLLPSWKEAGGQIGFIGVLLVLLVLVWIRAAVLIYALFFGLVPFTGIEGQVSMLFTSFSGLMLLLVGTSTGGLFAAFAFAISVFSIPMLLEERSDAFTAMGTSMALVWANLPVMIVWGTIVLGLFLASCLTAFVGLIVIFPLLGHATWHAYHEMRH